MVVLISTVTTNMITKPTSFAEQSCLHGSWIALKSRSRVSILSSSFVELEPIHEHPLYVGYTENNQEN